MLWSKLVLDESNNYWLWKHIQKITWSNVLLARNNIFLFLHWYQPPATSNWQMMVQSWSSYQGLRKFKAMWLFKLQVIAVLIEKLVAYMYNFCQNDYDYKFIIFLEHSYIKKSFEYCIAMWKVLREKNCVVAWLICTCSYH